MGIWDADNHRYVLLCALRPRGSNSTRCVKNSRITTWREKKIHLIDNLWRELFGKSKLISPFSLVHATFAADCLWCSMSLTVNLSTSRENAMRPPEKLSLEIVGYRWDWLFVCETFNWFHHSQLIAFECATTRRMHNKAVKSLHSKLIILSTGTRERSRIYLVAEQWATSHTKDSWHT